MAKTQCLLEKTTYLALLGKGKRHWFKVVAGAECGIANGTILGYDEVSFPLALTMS